MVRYRYRTTGEVFDHEEIRNFFNAQAQERGVVVAERLRGLPRLGPSGPCEERETQWKESSLA